MNSSLWSADLVTHTKIVAVSLVAAIAVVAIGIGAHVSNTDSTSIRIDSGSPVVIKAGAPATFSANSAPMIR